MDIILDPKYKRLQEIYQRYFSVAYLNEDISSKFALISLVSILVRELRKKKSGTTYYHVLKSLGKDIVPEDVIIGLAIVCEDFSYGAKTFPDFGISVKDMPAKIKELLNSYIPF